MQREPVPLLTWRMVRRPETPWEQQVFPVSFREWGQEMLYGIGVGRKAKRTGFLTHHSSSRLCHWKFMPN